MTSMLSFLFSISRPRFWLYLAGPFLIGAMLAVSSVYELSSLSFLLWLLFFLLPANLFLYGINDIYDSDTDKFNAKKGSKEHLLRAREKRTLVTALACTVLIYAVAFVSLTLHTKTRLAALLLVLLALSAGYSMPPVRFKARPFLDSSSNILYLVPGIFGYALYANALPSLPVLIGLGCWTAAMHLYSAIPDIAADKKAQLQTTAVVIGERASLLLCALLWLVFTLALVFTTSLGALAWFGLVYVALPVIPLLIPAISVEWLYWRFPWITGIAGFLFWWYIALQKLG